MTGDQRAEFAAPTPGPWTNDKHSTHVWSKSGNVCVCGDPRAESVVGYTRAEVGSPGLYEAIANARMIAAAPDLLAALQDCIRCLDSEAMRGVWCFLYTHGISYQGPFVDMKAARAAIAKATGPQSQTSDHQSDASEQKPVVVS